MCGGVRKVRRSLKELEIAGYGSESGMEAAEGKGKERKNKGGEWKDLV